MTICIGQVSVIDIQAQRRIFPCVPARRLIPWSTLIRGRTTYDRNVDRSQIDLTFVEVFDVKRRS